MLDKERLEELREGFKSELQLHYVAKAEASGRAKAVELKLRLLALLERADQRGIYDIHEGGEQDYFVSRRADPELFGDISLAIIKELQR